MRSQKTFAEASEELNAAFREVGDAFAEATVKQPFYRKIIQFSDYMDRRFPVVGRVGDRAPKWMRFGTSEWFQALGTLWIGITIGATIWWLVLR